VVKTVQERQRPSAASRQQLLLAGSIDAVLIADLRHSTGQFYFGPLLSSFLVPMYTHSCHMHDLLKRHRIIRVYFASVAGMMSIWTAFHRPGRTACSVRYLDCGRTLIEFNTSDADRRSARVIHLEICQTRTTDSYRAYLVGSPKLSRMFEAQRSVMAARHECTSLTLVQSVRDQPAWSPRFQQLYRSFAFSS
jgi:hypothetical protein